MNRTLREWLPWGLFSQLWRYKGNSFLGGSDSEEAACNTGDPGSISGLGRSAGRGNGNPLQYSCPENPMDSGAWWATVHEVAKV